MEATFLTQTYKNMMSVSKVIVYLMCFERPSFDCWIRIPQVKRSGREADSSPFNPWDMKARIPNYYVRHYQNIKVHMGPCHSSGSLSPASHRGGRFSLVHMGIVMGKVAG
jgi:hypothetical protein